MAAVLTVPCGALHEQVADRISLPLFLHPNWTSLIDPTLGSGGGEQQGEAAPPQFPSVTVGDFMSKWHTGRLYREDDQLSKL
jgi:isopenicillin N synthase-like dioxygenase